MPNYSDPGIAPRVGAYAGGRPKPMKAKPAMPMKAAMPMKPMKPKRRGLLAGMKTGAMK